MLQMELVQRGPWMNRVMQVTTELAPVAAG